MKAGTRRRDMRGIEPTAVVVSCLGCHTPVEGQEVPQMSSPPTGPRSFAQLARPPILSNLPRLASAPWVLPFGCELCAFGVGFVRRIEDRFQCLHRPRHQQFPRLSGAVVGKSAEIAFRPASTPITSSSTSHPAHPSTLLSVRTADVTPALLFFAPLPITSHRRLLAHYRLLVARSLQPSGQRALLGG